MDIKEIEAKVADFLINELEIDEDKVFAESRLKEDMGIDSLEIVDVVVLVDQEFGFKMKQEDFKDLKTMADFCNFISSKL